MDGLVIEQLSIQLVRTEGRIRLGWLGTSRLENTELSLAPFLRKIADDAAAEGASIEMHIESASFFNSATMAAVIRFIKVALDQRVAVELSFNPGQEWQRIFAGALRIFDRRDGLFTLRPT